MLHWHKVHRLIVICKKDLLTNLTYVYIFKEVDSEEECPLSDSEEEFLVDGETDDDFDSAGMYMYVCSHYDQLFLYLQEDSDYNEEESCDPTAIVSGFEIIMASNDDGTCR